MIRNANFKSSSPSSVEIMFLRADARGRAKDSLTADKAWLRPLFVFRGSGTTEAQSGKETSVRSNATDELPLM